MAKRAKKKTTNRQGQTIADLARLEERRQLQRSVRLEKAIVSLTRQLRTACDRADRAVLETGTWLLARAGAAKPNPAPGTNVEKNGAQM